MTTAEQIVERLRKVVAEAAEKEAVKGAVFTDETATAAQLDAAFDKWTTDLHVLYGAVRALARTVTVSDSTSTDVCSAPSCVAAAILTRNERFEVTPAGRAALAEHPRHLAN